MYTGNNTASFTGRVTAIPAKASAWVFSERWILLMAHLLNLFRLVCNFERYRAMHSFLASYCSWICLTTRWESLRISSLDADKVRARLSLARIASYSASLLEAGNPSPIACSSCSLVGDCKRRPISDPEAWDTPSTCSIHHLLLGELTPLWGF